MKLKMNWPKAYQTHKKKNKQEYKINWAEGTKRLQPWVNTDNSNISLTYYMKYSMSKYKLMHINYSIIINTLYTLTVILVEEKGYCVSLPGLPAKC